MRGVMVELIHRGGRRRSVRRLTRRDDNSKRREMDGGEMGVKESI